MATLNKIIVGLDPADQEIADVIRFADNLAQKQKASLVFVSILEPVPIYSDSLTAMPMIVDVMQDRVGPVKRSLEKFLAKVKSPHVIHVEMGHPSEVIRRLASRQKASLIILKSHNKGKIERFFMGSVADSIAKESKNNVLILRGNSKDWQKISKIAFLVDLAEAEDTKKVKAGEQTAKPILKEACKMASLLKAPIQPISMVSEEYFPTNSLRDLKKHFQILIQERTKHLQLWLKKLVPAGVRVLPPIVTVANPRRDLAGVLKKTGVGLAVLGRHRRVGPRGILMGRVAVHLLHESPVSLLLLSPEGSDYKTI